MRASLLSSLCVLVAVTFTVAEDTRPSAERSAEKSPEKTAEKTAEKPVPPALAFKVKDIDGKDVDLASYRGKVLLIVNVASRCGLTDKQYDGLEKLYRKYKDRGFEILALPANNFGAQEPGSDGDIKKFCAGKGATFKIFSKISVKGDDIHPLYRFLTSKETNGAHAGEIRWNFQKFLVGADGQVAGRFDPPVDPLSKDVTDAVEKALKGVAPEADKGK
jgi:glutathione peroxidase